MKLDNFTPPRIRSSDDPEIIAERAREDEIFSQWVDKKIRIHYKQKADWISREGTYVGKIFQLDGIWCFRSSRMRTRYYHITLGLHHGAFGTFTLTDIEEV